MICKELIISIIKHDFVASHFLLFPFVTFNKNPAFYINQSSNQTVLLSLQATAEDSDKTQRIISEESYVLASPTRQRPRSMTSALLQQRKYLLKMPHHLNESALNFQTNTYKAFNLTDNKSRNGYGHLKQHGLIIVKVKNDYSKQK